MSSHCENTRHLSVGLQHKRNGGSKQAGSSRRGIVVNDNVGVNVDANINLKVHAAVAATADDNSTTPSLVASCCKRSCSMLPTSLWSQVLALPVVVAV